MVRLPRNEKQTYRLNPGTQMRPSDLTLAITLTLGITLTLNFQSQVWNLLYLNEKWSDCYETKSKISIELQASNVTNGFDLDHDLDIWIFKVKCNLDHLVTKVRRKDLPDRDRVTSDVGVPSTRLVRFWSRSVDFTNFGGILTQWNISNVWFPYLMENARQLWPDIWHADVSWLPLELLRFGHGLLIFLILAGFWPSEKNNA